MVIVKKIQTGPISRNHAYLNVDPASRSKQLLRISLVAFSRTGIFNSCID